MNYERLALCKELRDCDLHYQFVLKFCCEYVQQQLVNFNYHYHCNKPVLSPLRVVSGCLVAVVGDQLELSGRYLVPEQNRSAFKCLHKQFGLKLKRNLQKPGILVPCFTNEEVVLIRTPRQTRILMVTRCDHSCMMMKSPVKREKLKLLIKLIKQKE